MMDRVQNGNNYFETVAFSNLEQGTSREPKIQMKTEVATVIFLMPRKEQSHTIRHL